MRKFVYISLGTIALLLVLIALLPFVLNVNTFRPQIEAAAGGALNRKVEIGNIRLSIFSGGIVAENISIADDPAFGANPFLKAKSLSVNVDLMPLIFSRALHVNGITIDQPAVTLLRSPSGTWNFSTIGSSEAKPKQAGAAADPSAGSSGPVPDVAIQKLAIVNGTLLVSQARADAKPREYDAVNLQASNISYSSQFPFHFTAKTPGNGSLVLDGKVGPLNRTDASQTPLTADLDLENLDLASTGFVDPSSDIAGLLSFKGNLASDGQRINSTGKIIANKLRVLPEGAAAGVPLQLDYAMEYAPKPQTGTLKQGDVHIGKAIAHLTGTFNNSGRVASLDMKLAGQDMPATDLEAVLPVIGIRLPSGATLQQGVFQAALAISGPLDRLSITGPVSLSNAKLAGFDLNSRLGALAALANLPKLSDTLIQTFAATLRIAPEGIRADNLNLVLPSVGSMTGAGTISPDQKLDFQMAAQFNAASGSLQRLAKLGAANQGNGIPFKIQGTTSDPKFIPDVQGIVSGLANGAVSKKGSAAETLGQALGGLLGKKKQ